MCHAVQGIGHTVGPDLASVASRRTDLLIADIIDPSQQVAPDFINYLVTTKDGRVLSGVIAAETTESVTLRREEGQQDTIHRSNIEELRASGKSIMPDGLEEKITPDQLADLLEFLRDPDLNQLN
jgi:putative heme-binding domain-containing protein